MLVQIEKGVPVAERQVAALPMRAMQVGDSFAVPVKWEARVRKAVWRYNRHPDFPGRGYVTRKENGQIRVWRVK